MAIQQSWMKVLRLELLSPTELFEVKEEQQMDNACMNAIRTSKEKEDKEKKLVNLIKLEASDVPENSKAELPNTFSFIIIVMFIIYYCLYIINIVYCSCKLYCITFI